MNVKIYDSHIFEDTDFKNWQIRWNERLKIDNQKPGKYLDLMRSVNPLLFQGIKRLRKRLRHR